MCSQAIFDVKQYVVFEFASAINRIYKKSELIYSETGYFIALLVEKENLKKNFEFTEIDIDICKRHKIFAGKLKGATLVGASSNRPGFFNYLLNEECDCIKYLTDIIFEHLNNRESEGEKLTNHDNVKILIGDTVRLIEEISSIAELNHLSSVMRKYTSILVRSACNNLAKLAGGRSFISTSVIEMLCLFEVINKIYLY